MILTARAGDITMSVELPDDSNMIVVTRAFRTLAYGLTFMPETVDEYIPEPGSE